MRLTEAQLAAIEERHAQLSAGTIAPHLALGALAASVPDLIADVRRLRAALAHYADRETWGQLEDLSRGTTLGEPHDWYRPTNAHRDGWAVARTALNPEAP